MECKNGLNNAKNFQIQSWSASIMNRSAIGIHREFKEKGLDLNKFTDVDSALVMFAKANAGWGSDPTSAIAAARKKAPAFSVSYA